MVVHSPDTGVDAPKPGRDGQRDSIPVQEEDLMPSSKNYKRDYGPTGEGKYDKSPKRMEDNRKRKAARRILEKLGKVSKNDGKDVDHKNGKPKDNKVSNLRPLSPAKNRSIPRTKTARKKNG